MFHALTELTGSRLEAIPRQLPAAIPHFAGRVDELAALDRLMLEVMGGARGTMVISAIRGTAGSAKPRWLCTGPTRSLASSQMGSCM